MDYIDELLIDNELTDHLMVSGYLRPNISQIKESQDRASRIPRIHHN